MSDPEVKRKVFLSYRRGPANGYANAIHVALSSAFVERGGADVFLDVDTLQPGEVFPSMIEEHLRKSDVLLALIGPDWEERIESDEGDWVRREIELAERLGVETIPVLLERSMPTLGASPELRAFAQRHAIDVKHGHWGSAIEKLAERIDWAAWQTRMRKQREHWARCAADVKVTVPVTESELANGLERSMATKILIGCGPCDGTGWIKNSVESCEACGGKGVTAKRREVTLAIPAGSAASTVLMAGAGHRLPGRAPGEILVELSLASESGEPIGAATPTLRARSRDESRRSPDRGPPPLQEKASSKRTLAALTLGLVLVTGAVLAWVAANRGNELNEILGKTLRADSAIASAADLMPRSAERKDAIRSWIAEAHSLLAAKVHAQSRAKELERAQGSAAVSQGAGGISSSDAPDQDLSMSIKRFLSRLEALELLLPEMERCDAWASNVEEATFRRRDEPISWDRVRETLSTADDRLVSGLYRGQDIPLRNEDVMGLVPLGINPVTKLWEFYDLRSAWDGAGSPGDLQIPGHEDGQGSVAVRERTGIVFVLVPGGEFMMGSQNEDRSGPNYDLLAEPDEQPVHKVKLAPFLIARHELTRAQWARLAMATKEAGTQGLPGSGGHAPGFDLLPMTEVSWTQAEDCLRRHGMVLPTEAQWEYACRAGSSWPWWTGLEVADLRRNAHVGRADNTVDPGQLPRRVGSARVANRFGLFDVHGNVMEWCQDQYGLYTNHARPGDGLRSPAGLLPDEPRVIRGGDSGNPPKISRSAFRVGNFSPETRDAQVGLRPVRRLKP